MKSKAYTLVEIVVTISIILILAAVVLPQAFRAVEKSKVTKAVADIHSIKTAALAFYADVKLWPGSQWGTMPRDPLSPAEYGEGFVTPPRVRSGSSQEQQIAQARIARWNGPYLEKWSFTPWGMPYMWDYNNWDANCNRGCCHTAFCDMEHILWLDLAHWPGPYDQSQKVPRSARDKLDLIFDSRLNKSEGIICEMDNGFYGNSIMAVVAEGY
ncbi:MAG: prepilin-type N-terminal cleavage/methylation domain-containing protein [Candidatus Omnitrophica bacterium]|nr:prepilin-type N-terminal cleavage/methylation domain-containing protein [Candidatus Omnitrophota bacterium]